MDLCQQLEDKMMSIRDVLVFTDCTKFCLSLLPTTVPNVELCLASLHVAAVRRQECWDCVPCGDWEDPRQGGDLPGLDVKSFGLDRISIIFAVL